VDASFFRNRLWNTLQLSLDSDNPQWCDAHAPHTLSIKIGGPTKIPMLSHALARFATTRGMRVVTLLLTCQSLGKTTEGGGRVA
jgi:hypothetical protein